MIASASSDGQDEDASGPKQLLKEQLALYKVRVQ